MDESIIGKLEKEKEELNVLINKGVTFNVYDNEVQTKRVFGIFPKHIVVRVKKTFRIVEPTLAVLDRLSAECIEIAIDEEKLKSDDGLRMAKALVAKDATRVARIIAIAVLGEELFVPVGKGGCVRYVEDTDRLNELTELFKHNIKPSALHQLYTLVNAMSNLGDFINSIRLMQADRSTMPIRIEEDNAG